MMVRESIKLCMALVFVMIVQVVANAEFVLEFGHSGAVGVSDFVVTPGSSMDLEVYLSPRPNLVTIPGVGTFPVAERGLVDEGLGAYVLGIDIGGAGVRLGDISSFRFGTGFFDDGTSSRVSDVRMEVAAFGLADGDFAVVPVKAPSETESVLLGTARFLVDADFVGSATITAGQANPDLSFFSLGSNPTSGLVNVGSVSASVTAVPEPGGLLALSVLGLGGVAWYRRRSVVKGTATMV